MKNYLSFGGGVNSVAMHLLLINRGWEFESVFVDHGTDWPETYEYLEMFNCWLQERDFEPVTILKPDVEGFDNLYDFCDLKSIIPSMMFRWCTDKFKVSVLSNYYKKPCFNNLGIDFGESHRAKLNHKRGIENRFPLIEFRLDRVGCCLFIEDRGLPVPMKSGCFICPYQKNYQWKELRTIHPDLFCKAEQLENKVNSIRKEQNKKPIYLSGKPLRVVVEEDQYKIFKRDEYPPCNCML